MLVRSRRESRKRSSGICLTGGGSVDEVVLADEDLALAMQSGNDVAFEALVHRYHGALVGYLYRMCHDYHLAEDAAQESFVRFYTTIARYQYPRPLKAYLFAIASNCLKDYLKSAYARRVNAAGVGKDLEIAAGGAGIVVDPRQSLQDPGDHTVRRMERNEVVQAIQQLSFIYREALVLRFYEDLSIRDIAEALGIPEGTVKSRLYTAVRRLTEVMLKGGDVACRSGA